MRTYPKLRILECRQMWMMKQVFIASFFNLSFHVKKCNAVVFTSHVWFQVPCQVLGLFNGGLICENLDKPFGWAGEPQIMLV